MVNQKKRLLTITLLLLIAIAVCILSYFGLEEHSKKEEVKEYVASYYDHIINKQFEEALSMICFSENTKEIKKMVMSAYESQPVETYHIGKVTKLESDFEFYQVDLSIKLVEEEPADMKNYVVVTDDEWQLYKGSYYVPREVYEFETAPEGPVIVLD